MDFRDGDERRAVVTRWGQLQSEEGGSCNPGRRRRAGALDGPSGEGKEGQDGQQGRGMAEELVFENMRREDKVSDS